MKFSEHMSLHVTHNQHKEYYESIQDYLENRHIERGDISPEDIEKIMAEDSIWEVQWYPRTPISFHYVAASTLERCIELMNEEG